MALSPEQVKELKQQLKDQVSSLPEDKKKQALQQIEELSEEALESMLEQQKEQASSGPQKTVFRMIIDGEIKAVKVAENDFALAVLDINPISPGHAMIIPKTAVTTEAKDLPAKAMELAKELTDRVVSKLKAKSAELQSEKKFGEVVLHLIPIYDKPLTIASPRTASKPEELEKIAEQIKIVEKKKIEKIKITKPKFSPSQTLKLKRRVP